MEYNTYSTSRHTQRTTPDQIPKNRVIVGGVNWVILITTILLLSFGMVMVFSASYDKYGYFYLTRNLIWAISGGVLMLIFSQINYSTAYTGACSRTLGRRCKKTYCGYTAVRVRKSFYHYNTCTYA